MYGAFKYGRAKYGQLVGRVTTQSFPGYTSSSTTTGAAVEGYSVGAGAAEGYTSPVAGAEGEDVAAGRSTITSIPGAAAEGLDQLGAIPVE